MKIGVRAHDVKFKTPEELISFCKENSIDGLQLVCMRTFPEKINKEAEIDVTIQNLINNNLEIFLLGSYFNMIHPNRQKLEAGYELFALNTEIAKRNNLMYIGSETGSVNGDSWTYHPDNHSELSFQKLAASIKRITKNIGNSYFLMEPVFDHVAYNLDVTKRMMLNDKVALTLDLANLLNQENCDNYLEIFEEYLREFATHIKLFHFKNILFINGNKVNCQLDKGIVDYQQILKIIKKYKLCNVPVIVEELQGKELINSIKYLRKLEEE